jgi:hypothetical protein
MQSSGIAALVKADEESCKTFNADLMRSIMARKMSKNKTFYEVKMMQANPINAGIGHLHGIGGGGMATNLNNGGPTAGHYSQQQPLTGRPHLSTA